eukprot:3419842-Pyramimonas_sp.AAC.1
MPPPQQGSRMFGNYPLINNPFAKTQMGPCAPGAAMASDQVPPLTAAAQTGMAAAASAAQDM